MATVADHRLLGWHNAYAGGKRIAQWLRERQDATIAVLSCIPGGKNVGQYMIQRGWFAFGPQVRPRQSRALSYKQLRNYEPVLLYLHSYPETKRHAYALGLVDRRLEVQPMLYQTPQVYVDQTAQHPSQFYWKSYYPRDEECVKEMTRIGSSLAALVEFAVGPAHFAAAMAESRKKYGWMVSTPLHIEFFPGRQSNLCGINVPPYAKFDHRGKKTNALLNQGQPVKVVMLADTISIGWDELYWTNILYQRVKQVQIMDQKCLFFATEDEET